MNSISKPATKCVLAVASVAILIVCPEEMKIALRNPFTARVPNAVLFFMDSTIDRGAQELRFLLASCGAMAFDWISMGLSAFCRNLLESVPNAQSYLRESATNRLSASASAHAYAAIKSSGEACQAGVTFAIAVCLASKDLLKFVVHLWNNEFHAYDAQFAQIRFAMAYALLFASLILCCFSVCQLTCNWIQGLITNAGASRAVASTTRTSDSQQHARGTKVAVMTGAHNAPQQRVIVGAQPRSYIHNQA